MVASPIWEKAEDEGAVDEEEVEWARTFFEERGEVI